MKENKDLTAKIQAWKAEHGKLFKSVIDGEEYIWRKLKRKEYVALMADKAEGESDLDIKIYERQENIAAIVVLHPENIQELIVENAGLATSIADEVIARSGFGISQTTEL